jgi:hypothetical protein
MPVAQSPDHYINSSKGCPSITESFLLVGFLVLCATVAALPVVQPHYVAPVKRQKINANSLFGLKSWVKSRMCCLHV